ncbi:MAG: peptidoglycan-binding domain-containing protein [Candidatus Nealsonbacteria bacterium]|nr:peptidoglycan-binding domain-containing protein [Candidatus Nealsonbacteria bacterium]
MKKIISLATILTVAAMVAGPGVNAATVAELQAQINTLMATLAGLQAQLNAAGGGTGSTPVACAGITSFTRNLTVGSTGTDVKCLQAMLNQNADHNVATTGAGSPGNETTYFGSLTSAAVSRYQIKHAINPPAGYFGPLTRASMNAWFTTGGIPGTPGTPGTVTPLTPAGTSGTAGSYTVVLGATGVNSSVISGADFPVYSFVVRAYGSDINISRTDMQVSVTDSNGVVTSPSSFVTNVKIYCGDTLAKEIVNPVFTLDSASAYFAQLSGFTCTIAKDATNYISFIFSGSTSSDLPRTVVVNVYGNGILGTDGQGVNTFSALATARTHTFLATSGAGTLTAEAAVDNPVSNNYYNDATSGTTSLTLLKFTLTAQTADVNLTRLGVNMASNVVGSLVLPSVIYLYDGDTVVASATDTTTRDIATFENFTLPVKVGTPKAMTVKANYLPIDSTANTLATNQNVALVAIPATSLNSVYMRGNGATIQTTIASIVQGNNAYLFRSGAKITLASAIATPKNNGLDNDSVDTVFVFNVTPFNGTFSEVTTAGATSSTASAIAGCTHTMFMNVYDTAGGSVATGLTRSVVTKNSGGAIGAIAGGDTGTLTATASVSDGTATDVGLIRFRVEEIVWDMTALPPVAQGLNTGNMGNSWVTNWAHLY